MLAILEKSFEVTKEVIDENVITRRLEDELDNVLVLEEAFFPPDEIETKIYIIKGELDIDLETELENLNCEIIE